MQQEPEFFGDQISRLKMMADPNESCYKWDLSDNDRAAIQALLDAYGVYHGKAKPA